VVAEPELPIERALAESIMQQGESPVIRRLAAGELLFRQGEEDTSVALILDGELEVCVDDRVVGRVGPGTVVGERSSLEAGRRTADLRAVSSVRIAQANAESLDPDLLGELAEGHRREDLT
jgi:CRP-like cAMP-binding protein